MRPGGGAGRLLGSSHHHSSISVHTRTTHLTMAVSRTFVRGIHSSFSSMPLVRPAASAIASTSRSAWPSLASSSSPTFSTTAAPRSSKGEPSKPEEIRISREKMEKMMDADDVGHDMTGGRVGKHSKRTLSTFSMVSARAKAGDGASSR